MRYAYEVPDVRAAEKQLMGRLPEGALMRRAAGGLATVAAGMLRAGGGSVYGSRVVLLVGVGDNGGDALYCGAVLARRGARVDAVLVDASRAHPGGLEALRLAGGRAIGYGDGGAKSKSGHGGGEAGGRGQAESLLSRADLIVDGLLGIGGRGGLRGAFASLAGLAESAGRANGASILAVDLPSGIDADTGEVPEPARAPEDRPEPGTASADPGRTALRADVTVTFGAHKPGLLVDPGAGYAGLVEFVDIGLRFPEAAHPAVVALQEADVRALLPEPRRSSHKYSRGVVGLAVGSERYPGAALLATGAALRSGVGAVRYDGPVDVVTSHPEVIRGDGRVQAWVVGSGLGQGPEARERLDRVLASDVPVVIDADGLRLLPAGPLSRSAPTVLTPHAGEAGHLLGVPAADIERQRLASVRRLAETYDATVLLKGAVSLICSPGVRTVRANTHASPYLATAGSGDILAGLIGGLLAGGLGPLDAASAAAYLHGAAGLLAARSGPIAAGDLVAALPRAWQNIRG